MGKHEKSEAEKKADDFDESYAKSKSDASYPTVGNLTVSPSSDSNGPRSSDYRNKAY